LDRIGGNESAVVIYRNALSKLTGNAALFPDLIAVNSTRERFPVYPETGE